MTRDLPLLLLALAWAGSASADGMFFCEWHQNESGQPYRIRYESSLAPAALVTATVSGIELTARPGPVFPDLDNTGKGIVSGPLGCDPKSSRFPDAVGIVDLNFRIKSNTLIGANVPLGACHLYFRCDVSGQIDPLPDAH